MKFGDNLRKLRKYRKISQEVLAEKVGVSRQSVSKWENGEAYPEMNNILILCKIFNCHINDLVHEDFEDIDSLDKEIKMSVVKLKKEQQKRMKGLSKAIYIISRIGRVIISLIMFFLIILMIIVPFAVSKININDNTMILNNTKYEYTIDKDNNIKIINGNNSLNISVDTNTSLNKYVDNISTGKLIISGEYILLCLFITFTFTNLFLVCIDKLFVNINKGETPFTIDNIKYIKKIAIYITLAIVFPFVTGALFQITFGVDVNIEIELANIMLIIIIISLAYIFEYGYQIQLDSKGVMYGEEK